jgi:hypothetical protein
MNPRTFGRTRNVAQCWHSAPSGHGFRIAGFAGICAVRGSADRWHEGCCLERERKANRMLTMARRFLQFAPLVTLLLVRCGGSVVGTKGDGGPGMGDAGIGGADAGGTWPSRCESPWDAGTCRGAFATWWHDPSTGLCMPVTYSGCGGNDNRFTSRAECQAACPGGNPNFDPCSQPTDCVLVSPGCCGGCEPVDDRMLVAINSQASSQYFKPCAAVSCGPCPPLPPGVSSARQYFVPACQNGECTVVDIREAGLTDCQRASDCVLRSGSSCCEACGAAIVSLNRNADLGALVCSSASPTACAPCIPAIPPGYSALCTAGRCTVEEPPCTMDHPCTL